MQLSYRRNVELSQFPFKGSWLFCLAKGSHPSKKMEELA